MKRRPPNVSYYRDRHGVVRWRFRKAGLPESQSKDAFGTAAWWAWYEAARTSAAPAIGSGRTKPGSIDALAVAFYESGDWQTMEASTRKTYRGILDRYRDMTRDGLRYGDLPAAMLQASHIMTTMDRMAQTPTAANNLLKVLRKAFAFAVARKWRPDNPAQAVKSLSHKSDGFHTWTEADITAYEARWALGTRERLAFDLLLYTAQRSGDVRQMGRQHQTGRFIKVRQQKTGEELEIPVHPRLAASLEACPSGHLTFIVTQHGEPYTEKGFGNWISTAATTAGLQPGAAAHGLRKAAARRLAEAGCSAHQIMSITGHRTLKEVERYTRAAAQRGLASSAMERIGGTEEERGLSNSPEQLDNRPRK